MGISVSILTATDGQIRAFAADVTALETLFIGVSSNPRACHLHDFWDGLHFVLTAETGDTLPLAAIERGDLHYRGTGDSMHALFAATTAALAQALSALPEPVLRARFDPPKMLRRCDGTMVYPGRLWTPGGEEAVFGELMGYFRRLRDYAAAAARAGNGLVFSRHEDW